MSLCGEIIKRELKLGDLVVVLFAILGIIASIVWISKPQNHLRVYVYKNNQLWGEYPLDKDRTIVIDKHNSIAISHGKVRMLSSDCPDRRCVKQGYSNFLPFICMPNKLILEIGASEKHRKLILQ